MKNNKGFIGIGIILAIIAVLAVGGGAYYLGTKKVSAPEKVEDNNILQNQLPTKSPENMQVKVYFHNKIFNPEVLDCSLVYPVDRMIPKTQAVASAALNELIKGPTVEDQTKGFERVIPDGTKLNYIKVVNGKATVDLNERIGDNFASCSGSMRLSAMSKTLLQFETIKEIEYTVNGKSNPDELQP